MLNISSQNGRILKIIYLIYFRLMTQNVSCQVIFHWRLTISVLISTVTLPAFCGNRPLSYRMGQWCGLGTDKWGTTLAVKGMEIEELMGIYNNILPYSPSGYSTSVYAAPIVCQALYQHYGELSSGGLLAVLSVWFGCPIASNTRYFSNRVCTTLYDNSLFTYVPPVGSLKGRAMPSSPLRSTGCGTIIGAQWCLLKKDGSVPVFGDFMFSREK